MDQIFWWTGCVSIVTFGAIGFILCLVCVLTKMIDMIVEKSCGSAIIMKWVLENRTNDWFTRLRQIQNSLRFW